MQVESHTHLVFMVNIPGTLPSKEMLKIDKKQLCELSFPFLHSILEVNFYEQ